MSKVITRFAPSPTGFLHIGGARTALFNWLFAKHHGGEFLLRIEDTDRKRSTDEAVDAIFAGMKWLGLDWDGDAYSQFERRDRHTEVANELLANGKAYPCYCSPEELSEMRDKARAAGSSRLYDGTWRDRDPAEAPDGVDPVIRLKAPLEGETSIDDAVQGDVTVANSQLDDMILLRADGTPTYMLAVVVDDYDMDISHVIRGDDHLTNTFRQIQIYTAMDWDLPIFAHMPLLHGADGAKLSKRHGALGVEAYRDMGFLPEAVNNYLLRLGWSHGDDEIISQEQAIEWFDLDSVGKSAARFDMDKLQNLNSHYINECDNDRLVQLILPEVSKLLDGNVNSDAETRLTCGINGLKDRSKNILELSDNAKVYSVNRPIEIEGKAAKSLDESGLEMVNKARAVLADLASWDHENLNQLIKTLAENNDVGLGKIAQPLRSALSGSMPSPGIFEVMEVLGKEETLARIDDVL
ncbi:MAG: glutamate--tRNA ligase [Rhodospirillaceae bacterium]|nr:glutamate--tRNA ligase [Rhodospirillaceae bacterium]MBT4589267.1 glutamate--tRNA ligase [Rhodospirillaceae bacterium]MBT5941098.1 glutamate--tRNA ligase [Rhodospirillaceae bacterium]MBT7268575.1 glutamate--tRNA ligase [Rhodospirillaceae bacterium]